MRSFMRSYDSATLVKTPATRSRFSASVTVSKPKCVGLDGSGIAYSGVEGEEDDGDEGFGAEEERVVEKDFVNRSDCSRCVAAPLTERSALRRAVREAMLSWFTAPISQLRDEIWKRDRDQLMHVPKIRSLAKTRVGPRLWLPRCAKCG
jgi:hypothetical protein